MSDLALVGGAAFLGRRLIPRTDVLLRAGRIAAIGPSGRLRLPRGIRRMSARGKIIAPGFIDIHIHGSGGCRAEEDAPGMARQVVKSGTTWFLPTFISNEVGKMLEAIDRVVGCVGPVEGGATIGGIHLEGPFLNPRYGAQRPETNVEPSPKLVRQLIHRCGPHLRLVTIAPERRGATQAIRAFRAAGAVVSIGHSDANEEEYRAGRAAGITHATHIFNAMPARRPPDYRYAGVKTVGIEELILADDGVSADIMSDRTGAHVHPALLKMALKCKGADRLSLITDAIPSAGLPAGEFKMADGQSIFTTKREDVARLGNGGLCGSVMSMCGALSNFIRHTGVGLEEALTTVTEAPARAVGVFPGKGSLAVGKDADVVVLDRALEVRATIVGGDVRYENL